MSLLKLTDRSVKADDDRLSAGIPAFVIAIVTISIYLDEQIHKGQESSRRYALANSILSEYKHVAQFSELDMAVCLFRHALDQRQATDPAPSPNQTISFFVSLPSCIVLHLFLYYSQLLMARRFI